jgi:Late competence development protein ComFB
MKSQPTYRNVMETLVIEALEHRIGELPIEHRTGCDLNDAIAYALNRLPAVYTTNEITWTRQRDRLRHSMGDLIMEAAVWGLERACQPRSQLAS